MEGNAQRGTLSSEGSDQGSSSVSDGNNERESQGFADGLVKLDGRTEVYENIKRRFILSLGSSLGMHTKIEAIHGNDFDFSARRKAKLLSFQNFEKALEEHANKRFAWFGASKDEIKKIISHGFGHSNQLDNTGPYDSGIYLSPYFSTIESVKLSIADDDEVRYMLLCRVLLGRVELIRPGSRQSHPSSEEFDSGVDDLLSPKKYIVWSTHMNTHILPSYVISFRIPSCLIGDKENQVPLRKPTSILMLHMSDLAKLLPRQTISLIVEQYREFEENKISIDELRKRIRQITGDKSYIDFREKGKPLPAVEGNVQRGRLSSVPMGTNVEYVSSSPVSECKKGVSGGNHEGESRALIDGLVKLDGREEVYETIKRRFISDLGSLGIHTKIEAIHRNDFDFSFERQAKLAFFQIFAKSMEKYANMKHAWFGASKDEINKIILHGFGHYHKSDNAGLYGRGIYLSPDLSHIDSVKSSIADDDEVRYMLLCRVLLGRVELVRPGSGQFHPSSEEFDSGVDDLESPKKYIVWNTHMNTRILPEYVISFRIPSYLIGDQKTQVALRKRPGIPFARILSALPKFLPPQTISLIAEHYREFRKQKISKDEFIKRIMEIAGETLMKRVVQSFY